MEENTNRRRMRKVSSWMADASRSIENEEEIIAGKKIVLKVMRYMESNHISQKELAEKLGVSPQYINKFLHGQGTDIKVSTAIKYGRALNLKLIDIPDDIGYTQTSPTRIYITSRYTVKTFAPKRYKYNREYVQPLNHN